MDDEINLITFDLIIDFNANRDDVKAKVLEEIQNKYPNYHFDAILDADYSDWCRYNYIFLNIYFIRKQ